MRVVQLNDPCVHCLRRQRREQVKTKDLIVCCARWIGRVRREAVSIGLNDSRARC